MITKSIGFELAPDPDFSRIPVAKGDCLLLCSDGLINHVSNEEMERMLMDVECRALPGAFIALAKERGGFDNITVVVAVIVESQH